MAFKHVLDLTIDQEWGMNWLRNAILWSRSEKVQNFEIALKWLFFYKLQKSPKLLRTSLPNVAYGAFQTYSNLFYPSGADTVWTSEWKNVSFCFKSFL